MSSVLSLIELVRHGINHGRRLVTVIQAPLDSGQIAPSLAQLVHSPDLPQAVSGDVLRQPERPGRPLNIPPHRLPSPMLCRVSGALKNPLLTRLSAQLLQELFVEVYPPSLPRFLLGDPELRSQLGSPQLHHIPDPQARCDTDPTDQPIGRSQGGKDMLHLGEK